MTEITSSKRFVGIDAAKGHADVFMTPDNRRWHIGRQPAQIDQFVAEMVKLAPQAILIEATGGYQDVWADALAKAGLPVFIVNPRFARSFAVATGQLAKTDRIDAKGLAMMAERMPQKRRYVVDPHRKHLAALLLRRRQLIAMRTAETNRLDDCLVHEATRQLVSDMRDTIEAQIREVEKLIDTAIKNHAPSCALVAALKKVKGVGDQTARSLLTDMPELGTLNRREVAALAGLAPRAHESGTKSRKRHIQGGRREARCALYMAAMTAAQWNPKLKPFYQRLLAAGQPKRSAIIAVARKLIIHLNTVARALLTETTAPAT